jgi:hypothetical protein
MAIQLAAPSREIRAMRGPYLELNHGWDGCNGFPLARPWFAPVRLSQTQSNLSDKSSRTKSNRVKLSQAKKKR